MFKEHDSAEKVETLVDELALIGHGVLCVHYAALGLYERTGRSPLLASRRSALLERAHDLYIRAQEGRQEVRDCIALAGEVSNAAQARIAEDRARQTHRFEIAAGIVAAFVLVPGLIVGIYGADVAGLPGQNANEGLIFMGGAGVLTGLATILILALVMGFRIGKRK